MCVSPAPSLALSRSLAHPLSWHLLFVWCVNVFSLAFIILFPFPQQRKKTFCLLSSYISTSFFHVDHFLRPFSGCKSNFFTFSCVNDAVSVYVCSSLFLYVCVCVCVCLAAIIIVIITIDATSYCPCPCPCPFVLVLCLVLPLLLLLLHIVAFFCAPTL